MTSPFWHDSFSRRRCLVPATAYCEPKGRGPAIYHWFGITGESGRQAPFAFAGVWKRFQNDGFAGDPVDAFAIATVEPNEFIARYHNRMPVILDAGEYDQWLSGTAADAAELLDPYDPGLMFLIAKGEGLKVCPSETPQETENRSRLL